ncbi:uncharacterized protein Scgbeta isoform X2 [Hetaerina americana]|uniref:uncharacterized protein Scgbeta isoform X2 n=1 Tax=Hetaerina americana TaxID=62018 RepID=UPI003A7F553A
MERNISLAGYVPVHEPSLGRTGVRGRKTFVLWALVLLLFALAAANLCLTLTVLGVLRVGHGMEAIEFLSELGILKFRGIADLDRVTKRDGRIQGFAGSPVEISGDGGSVLFDLGASVAPRISLDEEGISMTGLESLDVLIHGTHRVGGGALGLPLMPPHAAPAVFSTRFPNFELPRGVRRLDVASATAKRLSSPVGSSLRLKSSSRVRLRGSEGAVLDGKELAWSADQDILLLSVNGSILLNGSKGVVLDVRSVPLVPMPPPDHVATLRRLHAVVNGERVKIAEGIGSNGEHSNLKEHKPRRADNQHRRTHFQPQGGWMESGKMLTPVRRVKARRLHRTVKQMLGDMRRVPYGMLRVTKGHTSALHPGSEARGHFVKKYGMYGIPWGTGSEVNSSHVGGGIAASRPRRGGKVGPQPQFKVCVCMPGGRLFRVPWVPGSDGCLRVAEKLHTLPPSLNPCI